MRLKHLILLMLVPLSEIKALYYNSELSVRFSLYTHEKKYLCNVLEDYSNVIIFSAVFYFFVFSKQDMISRKIILGLFVLNTLDFFHFGIMDIPFFVIPKIALTFLITWLWLRLKPLSNF
jgi:hypothetical protein